MKNFQRASLAATLLLFEAAFASPNATPVRVTALAVESNEVKAQQRVCHHYRWSSQSHCTSKLVLREFYGRPLHYPHKYYGGTPHYRYVQPYSYYWSTYPWYAHHRWYRWPYRSYSPWY